MRVFAKLGLLVLVVLSPLACSAQDDGPMRYLEGEQYRKVARPVEPKDPSKVRVVEVFWYGCGHCYAYEPYVSQWAETRPGDVLFERMPNSLGRQVGLLHSRAFYAADQLGVEKQFTPKIFEAMHDHHQRMATESEIGTLFAQLGIERDKFQKTFEGFGVSSRVESAEKQSRAWGVTGTPSVIVGGKYMTSPQMAGGAKESLEVIDFLIAKVRDERD